MSPIALAMLAGCLATRALIGDAYAHGGSADHVPKGCRIVVEKMRIHGLDVLVRNLVCTERDGAATS